jgi:HTH-type transcriptional regulator/antitoxin HigA
MDIHPIRTEQEHAAALVEIDALWGAEEGTSDADRLSVLTTLVDAYEHDAFPLPSIDPVEAILARMDMEGYTRADFAVLIGSQSRASEILNRRRGLTMEMAHKLHSEWKIPAELLITPYVLKRA